MKIILPHKVNFIIQNLQLHGFQAYAVGGCVRDCVLAKKPQDWDITTSAKPREVKRLFPRTIDTGIEHGTVTVLLGGSAFEVTTYRIDGKYEDGRHPANVHFTADLCEDLRRRDFTINAMAYNDEERLIDPFDGMQDLSRHCIRCVGNPRERFSEDALRILRAVRFSAQLDFSIEEETKQAIREMAGGLERISAERIRMELVKLLQSDHPEAMRTLCELGITGVILPEWDRMVGVAQHTPHHSFDVAEHTIQTLCYVKNDIILRLTMLFHDMGKVEMKTTDEAGVDHFKGHALVSEEIARRVLRRLKFDNDTIYKVTHLVRYHDDRFPAVKKSVRRAMNRIGTELFPYYLAVRMADTKGQSTYMRKEKITNIVEVSRLYQEILAEKQCVDLKGLAVSGKDLLELGMKQGHEIGDMLEELLEKVIDDPEKNHKEILCAYVKEKMRL